MGAIKSITHAYAANQYLFWYIEKKDLPKICQTLEKRPDLINNSLTINFKTTPLHRAATNGSVQICELLVQKYGALVDFKTENGQTPLIGATKRNMIEVVKYLLKSKADPEIVSGCGLKAVEYAILQGFYEVALLIYESMKEKDLKTDKQYEQLGRKYLYRYVNYSILCQHLTKQIQPQNVPDFLTKVKKIYDDPVVDPRQTWKAWFVRNLEFHDPPLCERSELPEDLQPQNRRFGKINYFFSKMAMTHLTQKPSFLPNTQSQVGTLDKINVKNPVFNDADHSEQYQMKTIS